MWPFGQQDGKQTTESGIIIHNGREDRPKFERIYQKQLDSRAFVTVTMKTYSYGRSKHGELKQPNGNAVWFDPDHIAEKILDPALVPLVQAFVDEVKMLDQDYIKPEPDSFIDERGVGWQRS